eukprot:SAG31_NODE_3721_length_3950_cov_2.867048_2_plen_127_part_00
MLGWKLKVPPTMLGLLHVQACYDGIDNVTENCCWQWKRDTSSDEVDGHVAAFAVAHSLLAETAGEKARLARTLCATVQYIVDGGLVYIDPVTGNRTTWCVWLDNYRSLLVADTSTGLCIAQGILEP